MAPIPENIIELIENKLVQFPKVKFQKIPNGISVSALTPEGFDIWVSDDGTKVTVGYAGWYQHFPDDRRQAYECFLWGLTDHCRLKVFSKGDRDYKWAAEFRRGQDWKGMGVVTDFGEILFHFWKTTHIRFLQNTTISEAEIQ